MDYTDAALRALEDADARTEEIYQQFDHDKERHREAFSADDLMFELAEAGDEIMLGLRQVDAGTLTLDRLGLMVVNIRNAANQRAAGWGTKLEGVGHSAGHAAAMAFLGVRV